MSKYISDKINNNATENLDNFIESDILKVGPLINTSKIGKLKDDRKYISSNDVDKLQNNLLTIYGNESKDDDYSVKKFPEKSGKTKK